MYDFDVLVFIGRFQPFHNAHLKTINIALQHSHEVIVALGSVQNDRSIKNPFFAHEREQMILNSFSLEQQKRIHFIHLIDVNDDEKWVQQVKDKVADHTQPSQKLGLIGHFKDDSSYYLKLFSAWKLFELDNLENFLSATDIRNLYFNGKIQADSVPLGTMNMLKKFMGTVDYQELKHAWSASHQHTSL
ncbi:nicotinate-nicotinamide nucleotide adenylyltransferase [Acinetobacter rathckeae]|uniref:nicotinate-nicotinamide nucleotide adenylyltransferase n=1 Tax=Acinetobacter rathckeae TaxID=2605272 RepID=UPI0018A32031|nr:nicotinate-nicotinamide nucleotide adenylyltransferase [Acinetobacter rathckeae]MBF7686951.1 nicotinate-nicotinamide nucleotide adenylyltransferase [Acinetobacter rathckeae]MBF7694645.1 nicotinate-nicotinamide nucleotide adenylyltransferase [Acinetobacter rathckeae]